MHGSQGGALAATRERLLDDFVALSLLVGNDFLPHLPSLHIHEGALDELLAMYVALRPVLAAESDAGEGFLTAGYARTMNILNASNFKSCMITFRGRLLPGALEMVRV